MRINPLLFVLLLTVVDGYTQGLSRQERKLVGTVSANNDQAIAFLEKVTNINSGTFNTEGVKAVGHEFMRELDALDFQTRWIDLPPEMKRAGHLFAEISGNKGRKLLLIGHLDTVFEEDSPFQRFERINDSTAHAPGGNDMKGGDVIVLFALKALHENNLLDDASIIVAFTGDEEDAGKPVEVSRKDLVDASRRSDIALGFETSTGFNYATVARRGSSGWKLEVEGKQAHSSGIFSEQTGAGAIFEMARILNKFYEEVRGEEYLTFNPGLALGGTRVVWEQGRAEGEAFGKTNVVAGTAVVNGGLRFLTEAQKMRARDKMKAIVAGSLPQTAARITFEDAYPAMSPNEGNDKLLSLLDEVSRDLGQGPVAAYDPGRRGAADISFVAEYVDCLDGLGTMGSHAHTPQETVNLNTIEALTRRTAVLIYRLINRDK